jgi:hypothetical protein
MMNHDQELTPAESDVRNQELVQDLQRMYTPTDEAQMVKGM